MQPFGKGFRRVRPLARKSKTRIRILEKKGLGFFFVPHRKRKLLPAGILFGAFLMVSLSFFVWDIQIEGNERFTEDVIFEFLKENGVYFGTPEPGWTAKDWRTPCAGSFRT